MSNRAVRIAGLTLLWIITIFQAAQFAGAGISKFGDHSGWTRMFQHWGLPHWFQLAIGVEEVVAAVLLAVPKTARLGAVLVVATMIGALTVRIGHGEFRHLEREIIPITFATIIFAARQVMASRGRHAAASAVA